MNPLLRGIHPGIQFLLYIAMILTFMGLGTVTAMAVGVVWFNIPLEELPAVLSNPEAGYADALMWMNNVTQVFTFLLPVILFVVLFGGKSTNRLMMRNFSLLVLLAPMVTIFSSGLIDLSAKINQALIPENSWLEKVLKPSEDLAEKLTQMMLSNDSSTSMVVTLLSIAVLPAICEEFAFRGVMQPLLAKMSRNVHVAIWATAAVFSLIHMQFYGFLPRMILGALLGYLVIWTGSIWASVLAHFVNNALAIFVFKSYGGLEPPDDSALSQWYSYLFSGAIFVLLICLFIKQSRWPWLSFEYLGITDKRGKGSEIRID